MCFFKLFFYLLMIVENISFLFERFISYMLKKFWFLFAVLMWRLWILCFSCRFFQKDTFLLHVRRSALYRTEILVKLLNLVSLFSVLVKGTQRRWLSVSFSDWWKLWNVFCMEIDEFWFVCGFCSSVNRLWNMIYRLLNHGSHLLREETMLKKG